MRQTIDQSREYINTHPDRQNESFHPQSARAEDSSYSCDIMRITSSNLLGFSLPLLLGGSVFALTPPDTSPATANKSSSYMSKFPTTRNEARPVAKLMAAESYTAVPNGEIWYDTDGNQIQAWGGSMLKEGDTYYWVGADMSTSLPGEPPNPALVNLYQSTDLLNWKKVTVAISVYTTDVNGNQPLTYCQVQRPKILKSATTGKYVIWGHWEEAMSYAPSQIITATADRIEGPYTITAKGHRRPGEGNNDDSAMGDRVGQPVIDWDTSPADDGSYPYKPVMAAYPPRILQYNSPDPNNPSGVSYVSQQDGYGTAQLDNWWSYQLSNVRFNMTLKALAVNMTPFDDTYYRKYARQYSISAADYIVRFPTAERSEVAKSVFIIGHPGDERQQLAEPVIGPTLDESMSDSVVLVNSGDAAFITVASENTTIYYTTDGSNPSPSNSDQIYWDGTRITVSGAPGTTLTVKALAVKDGDASKVVEQTYQISDDPSQVPIFTPIINWPSGTYTAESPAFGYMSMRIYSPSYGTELYYTMDGLDPNPPAKGDNMGYGSRDFTVWQDPKSGEHFFITAADHLYTRVWKVTDDLTDVVADKEYDVFVHESREAPALIRHHGKEGEWVYMVTSGQSGWFTNQGQYKRTRSLSDGFNEPRDEVTGYRDGRRTWTALQPIGDPSTYWSQSTWIENIGTDQDPVYIFIGDRYNTITTNLLQLSTYVFIPLYIDDDTAGQSGVTGSGNMTLVYDPAPKIDVKNHRIIPPEWRLLSLNQPVTASPSVALSPAEQAAGTFNYSAEAANNGINYDVDPYDDVANYYKPNSIPFFWQVDLGQAYDLSWIGLSFMSVGGSDAVNRYTVSASKDLATWTILADNTQNLQPGFQPHRLSGEFRYVKLIDYSVWDVAHNKGAEWQAAVYEVSVYGQ